MKHSDPFHSQCQRVHMQVTERDLTKLCHMFGSGPDWRVHVTNLGGSLPKTCMAPNCLLSGDFTTTRCNFTCCLRNETRYRQTELRSTKGLYIVPKSGELCPQTLNLTLTACMARGTHSGHQIATARRC